VGEISEGELRAKLRDGEKITGVIVVNHIIDDALEYTPFLLLSWRRGYFRIALWRGGERRYREFSRLLKLLRQLGWMDGVTVFDAADPKLRRVRAVARALGVPPTPRGKKDSNEGLVPVELLDSPPLDDGDEDEEPSPPLRR
jgi:hypothetical protein